MKTKLHTSIAAVADFSAFAYSVHALLWILWRQFGDYPATTLAIGFWLGEHFSCSVVVAVAIALRSWLVAEATKPALIFGGIVVIGSASQQFWPSLDLSFSVSVASLALYAALFMRATLVDLSNVGIGSKPEQKESNQPLQRTATSRRL